MQKFCLTILFLLPALLFANTLVNADCMPVVAITENRNNICVDSAISFKAKINNAGMNATFKWKRNNSNVGTNNSTYTAADFHEGDVVTCEYSCTSVCGTQVTVLSNPVTVHVINEMEPSIIVGNTDSLICEGELTFFTSEAFYGNALPSYQWKVDDLPIRDTTPFYTTDTLTNGSKVECVLTTRTPGCPGTKTATGWMTIYVYPLIHPAIKITPSKADICRGETVTFTATANGGAYPSFAWELNGIPTGDTSAALVTSNLNDGDTISCTITIDQDSRCHTTTSAPSNKVVMHVKDYADPEITINGPLLDACIGTPLSFIATTKNTGDYILYEWQVNDHFTGGNQQTFITDKLHNKDKISCILTTNIPGCDFSKDIPSNYKVVTIRDTPVITFTPPNISILSGETAQLNATVSGNVVSFVWTPADLLITPQSLTTDTQPLGDDVVFNLSVTDVNSCTSSNDLAVKVLYKMRVPSAFTPNSDGLNDVFRIPPGSSFVLSLFAVYDRWGHIIFETRDISKGWDGTNKGIALPVGTYVYLIRGTMDEKPLAEKGTVTLIR